MLSGLFALLPIGPNSCFPIRQGSPSPFTGRFFASGRGREGPTSFGRTRPRFGYQLSRQGWRVDLAQLCVQPEPAQTDETCTPWAHTCYHPSQNWAQIGEVRPLRGGAILNLAAQSHCSQGCHCQRQPHASNPSRIGHPRVLPLPTTPFEALAPLLTPSTSWYRYTSE